MQILDRTGSLVPEWLVDWAALKNELDRLQSLDPRRVGDLLEPALKLAPMDNEAAQVLNCIAHHRARWAKTLEDIRSAVTGFTAALERAQDTELMWKIKLNAAWLHNILGSHVQAQALALDVFPELPPGHYLQYVSRYHLGLAWAATGEYKSASTAFRSTLPLVEPGTARHARVITCLVGLAVYQGAAVEFADQLARIPPEVCTGATWILRSVLALSEDKLDACRLAVTGIERIELSPLNWQERFNLAVGYRVLAANSYGATRNHLCRIAEHFAGTVRPRWVSILFDYIAAREGDLPQ